MGIAIKIDDIDFSSKNLGQVELLQNVPVTNIEIESPESYRGEKLQLMVSYQPYYTSQRDVIWSIVSGNEYASINAEDGVMTIDENADDSLVVVKAVSVYSTTELPLESQVEIHLTYYKSKDYLDSITIIGDDEVTGKFAEYSVEYNPEDTTRTGVKWEIVSGEIYATIDELTGKLTIEETAVGFHDIVIKATSVYFPNVYDTKTVSIRYYNFIDFEDPEVERICLDLYDTNHDGYLSFQEAQAVTNPNQYNFGNNTIITKFNELQYFGLTQIGGSIVDNNPVWFYGCTNLEEVTLPFGLKTLSSSTRNYTTPFGNCTNLKTIHFNETLENITPNDSNGIFANCSSLTNVELPKSLKKIGRKTFEGCTALTIVGEKIDDNVEEITLWASFTNCENLVLHSLPENATYILPPITTSSVRTFYNCKKLDLYSIPHSITYLSSAMFQNAYIPNMTLHNGINDFGSTCFQGATIGFTSLPEGATTIRDSVFNDTIFGNKRFTLPSTVTTMGRLVFYNAKNLTELVLLAEVPPEPFASGNNMSMPNNCYLYVPDASVDVYKTSTYFKNVAARINPISELPEV